MERYLPSSYAAVFLWGLAVLIGLIGLGRLVARAVGGEEAEKAGWGLHAVWGIAVYLFAGGFLALFGACGESGITLLIGAGLAMMIWTTARGGWPTKAAIAAIPWQTWPAFAVVALTFAGGICWQFNLNECDDLATYYNFCEKLLSTGSFDEPFSWRRLASLGGHTLLQCSVLAHASWANAQAFEVALCPVILLGLILGFRRGALGSSQLGLLIALLAVTTPIIRMNSTSHLTGVVLLAGLFVTLDLIERTALRRHRVLVVAGLVAAALCSLRAQNVPVAVGALGLFWLGSWIKDKRPSRAAIMEAACWGGSLFAALLPWMIMAWLSNGSPLFPLFNGGNNFSFNPQSVDAPLQARMALPVRMILDPPLLPLVLCLLALPAWRQGLSARACSAAAVLTSVALTYSINLAPDLKTVERYVQPLLLAGGLSALMTGALLPRMRRMTWALCLLLVATSFGERCDNLLSHYAALSCSDKVKMPFGSRVVLDHRDAQALVPEGKRILVCSDFPFLFDHQRNPIWTIDLPNAASPAPGLPFQKPPDEMKRYLRNLGIEYLIFVNSAESYVLYNRKIWQTNAEGKTPLWKIQAPFFLDFFDTTERLAASEVTLGKVGKLNVIHLKP